MTESGVKFRVMEESLVEIARFMLRRVDLRAKQ